MLDLFTKLADLIVYDLIGMEQGSHLAGSIHFFIEDTTKIFFLLIVMIYTIAWLRASLNIEKVRDYLSGHNRFIGYVAGAVFGAVTPFCSCSSIPLFFGFTQARIPLGITMSFLITSPIVNEVAVVLLGSLLGVKFMIIYVTVGIISGIIGGAFLDTIKAERFLTPLVKNISNKKMVAVNERTDQKLTLKDRHNFAKDELFSIFSRVWIWVIAGVGLGAALHGLVPESWVVENLGSEKLWTVPVAVLIGIPLYSNATGIIPVAESLLAKGLPVGTTLAFMMSTVAASFPEFILLKQVMKKELLFIFFGILLFLFTVTGTVLNIIF
jgi:uncharacterized protein